MNYLVVCALGEKQPGIVYELSKLASQTGCNIVESRMTTMGREFSLMMLLQGEWNALAKMEHQVPVVATRLGLTTMIKRTTEAAPQADAIPYRLQITAKDNPGIIGDIAEFLAEHQIPIIELNSDSFTPPHSGTAMVRLTLVIHVPGHARIADLREEFTNFCDDRNLDAIMEPYGQIV
ncbi:MAG: glycine cleavage system protein R [Gammaproteobacteria bacterium]|nr:MAG: glycine cleavage system protein R [Gammaproteobacteria bacterium]